MASRSPSNFGQIVPEAGTPVHVTNSKNELHVEIDVSISLSEVNIEIAVLGLALAGIVLGRLVFRLLRRVCECGRTPD